MTPERFAELLAAWSLKVLMRMSVSVAERDGPASADQIEAEYELLLPAFMEFLQDLGLPLAAPDVNSVDVLVIELADYLRDHTKDQYMFDTEGPPGGWN